MEVKRVKSDLGFTKYEVVGCNHVRITVPTAPYGYGYSSSSWTIRIPDLSSPTPQGGYATRAIYYSRTLNGIKEVLSRFSTEEELFGAYYKSRLAGKTQLF